MASVRNRVEAVFREVLEDEELVLSDDMTADTVKNWDSLNHINIVVMLEAEFGLQFQAEEIAKLPNVGAFFKLLASYGITDD